MLFVKDGLALTEVADEDRVCRWGTDWSYARAGC